MVLDDPGERLALTGVVSDFQRRKVDVGPRCRGNRLSQPYQVSAMVVRKRLNQDAIDEAEDGGVGADAERQGGDDRGGESGTAP